MTGKFIVFEGLDGSGITTQATLLRNHLQSKSKEVVLTKEPTDGLIGGIIKSCLRHEWKTNSHTLQLLFTADRAHHLQNEIDPSLKKNKFVICDRYILSSLAFGSMDVSLSLLKQINANFRKPDITIFVDTLPSICIERIRNARPHVELFEQVDRLEEIRRHYISLKSYFSTKTVDGNKKPEEVLNNVIKIVEKI